MLKVNGLGTNEKIKFHFDEELLKQNGFHYHEPLFDIPAHWTYFRGWKVGQLKILFLVNYYLEFYKGAQLGIDVLDDDYLQPYDYQLILERNPNHEHALKVKEFVEEELEKLQAAGILSGHKRGEYV